MLSPILLLCSLLTGSSQLSGLSCEIRITGAELVVSLKANVQVGTTTQQRTAKAVVDQSQIQVYLEELLRFQVITIESGRTDLILALFGLNSEHESSQHIGKHLINRTGIPLAHPDSDTSLTRQLTRPPFCLLEDPVIHPTRGSPKTSLTA